MELDSSMPYKCCECGVTKAANNYNKSYSPVYDNIGHLPICKDCLAREYKRYKIEYMNPRQAMQRVCMAFDIYYNQTIFESCANADDSAVMGSYLKKMNLNQCRGKTFDTTIEEGFAFGFAENPMDEKAPKDEADNRPINQKLVDKWGEGLHYIDYDELEKHYKFLKSANPNGDSNQEIFILELCYTKMQQLKAIREGRTDDYNKMTESYRKTFQLAGLKTVRDTNANDSFLLGVSAEMIENYTPAEYYRDKDLYTDHDNLGDYISRFLLRPLKNLMFGTNERDSEFYVKESGDADEYAEEE